MDPASAAAAGVTLYQAGGLALVLIGIQVAGGVFVMRWMMSIIRDYKVELKEAREQSNGTLSTVVSENTRSNDRLCAAVDRHTNVIEQQTEALRARPCLVPPQEFHAHPTPLPVSRR